MRKTMTNGLAVAGLVAAALLATPAFAAKGRNDGQAMIPGIWVDPDGCEHWVMDDGWEGYMSPVVLPNGQAVCGRDPSGPQPCGLVASDQFFETDSAEIPVEMNNLLVKFFRDNRRREFVIEGHTDSRGTDAYNVDLSNRRALAVAAVGTRLGANIKEIRGAGEGRPRARNDSSAGMTMNRRVEIMCVR